MLLTNLTIGSRVVSKATNNILTIIDVRIAWRWSSKLFKYKWYQLFIFLVYTENKYGGVDVFGTKGLTSLLDAGITHWVASQKLKEK